MILVIILIIIFITIEYFIYYKKEKFGSYVAMAYNIPKIEPIFDPKTNDLDDELCQIFLTKIKTTNNFTININQNNDKVYNNLASILYNVLVKLVTKVDSNTINTKLTNLSKQVYNCIEAPMMGIMANCGSNLEDEMSTSQKDSIVTTQSMETNTKASDNTNLQYIDPDKMVNNNKNIFQIPFTSNLSQIEIIELPGSNEKINKDEFVFPTIEPNVISYINTNTNPKMNLSYDNKPLSIMPFCAIMYNHLHKKHTGILNRINKGIDICNKNKIKFKKLIKISKKSIDTSSISCLSKLPIPKYTEYKFLDSFKIKDKSNKELVGELWNKVITIEGEIDKLDTTIQKLTDSLNSQHKIFEKLKDTACPSPSAWSKGATMAALGKNCSLG